MNEEAKVYPVLPTFNNLMIEKVDLVERRIELPGQEKEGENLAKVLAAGPGRVINGVTVPTIVKAGDYIVVGGNFNKYRVGELEFLFMNENSIIGVVTDLEALKKKPNLKNPSTLLKG